MTKNDPLSVCITHAMEKYFDDLNGQEPTNLHNFFINEVEKPFLEVVMQRVNGNQTRAADILGINRNTLRKKLKTYDLC
ncbi:helix-turn-helix domain-containing protein [Arenicella sp. 4NH20-0111]|uniref:helix-turn-helix domain-containing protein n=1 Tax=Arenicella sp. 4NH20-0111 TaxID=3127648 RepID=UPI00310A7CEC